MPVKPWPSLYRGLVGRRRRGVLGARVRLDRAAAVVERLQELAQRLGRGRGASPASSRSSAISSLDSAGALLPIVEQRRRASGTRAARPPRTARARRRARRARARRAQLAQQRASARRSARPSCAIVGSSSSRKRGRLPKLAASRLARGSAGDLGGLGRPRRPSARRRASRARAAATTVSESLMKSLDDLVLVGEDPQRLGRLAQAGVRAVEDLVRSSGGRPGRCRARR